MVRVGTAGWSVPTQYAPEFPGEGTHLARYARVLNCAEINSSFYRPHKPSTWRKWAQSVPADFRFSVKAPRTITHDCNLSPAPSLLPEFFAQCTELGENLGPVLFQLPPSQEFSPNAADLLEQIRSLYKGLVVLEPRHASWFTPQADNLLRSFAIARAAADPARHATASQPGGDASLAYYRLHGSPRMYYSAYTPQFLAELAKSIAAASQPTWVIFDNTALGHALANAFELARLVNL